MVRKIIKKPLEFTLKPLLLWYLRKDRHFLKDDLRIVVKHGVFHPLFFYSSLILLSFLKKQNLRGKTFLEPGCGSGFLSLWAAKNGALATAFDINPAAVANARENAKNNHLEIRVLESNLFAKLEPCNYDFIIINPPYYPRKPLDDSQFAWYCGPDFEYFNELFMQLPAYYNQTGMVIMVLSRDCAIDTIKAIAGKHEQTLELIDTSGNFLEKNFLFRIFHDKQESSGERIS